MSGNVKVRVRKGFCVRIKERVIFDEVAFFVTSDEFELIKHQVEIVGQKAGGKDAEVQG